MWGGGRRGSRWSARRGVRVRRRAPRRRGRKKLSFLFAPRRERPFRRPRERTRARRSRRATRGNAGSKIARRGRADPSGRAHLEHVASAGEGGGACERGAGGGAGRVSGQSRGRARALGRGRASARVGRVLKRGRASFVRSRQPARFVTHLRIPRRTRSGSSRRARGSAAERRRTRRRAGGARDARLGRRGETGEGQRRGVRRGSGDGVTRRSSPAAAREPRRRPTERARRGGGERARAPPRTARARLGGALEPAAEARAGRRSARRGAARPGAGGPARAPRARDLLASHAPRLLSTRPEARGFRRTRRSWCLASGVRASRRRRSCARASVRARRCARAVPRRARRGVPRLRGDQSGCSQKSRKSGADFPRTAPDFFIHLGGYFRAPKIGTRPDCLRIGPGSRVRCPVSQNASSRARYSHFSPVQLAPSKDRFSSTKPLGPRADT